MKQDSENSIAERPGPVLARADIATLVGMVLCIASLFLIWKREPVSQTMLAALPATLVVRVPPTLPVSGFELPIHWPLTFCAALCGAGLLVAPRSSNRSRWAALLVTSAAVCLLLPLLRFAVQPGVFTALLGGALTLYGALERWGIGVAPAKPEAT